MQVSECLELSVSAMAGDESSIRRATKRRNTSICRVTAKYLRITADDNGADLYIRPRHVQLVSHIKIHHTSINNSINPSSLILLSPYALLHLATFPLPFTPIILPPDLQILLGAPILLHHQSPQPLILRLQLSNALLQLERLVLQLLRRLLERLFALLLLDAEACRSGGVAAAFVFFGREAGGGGFELGGVLLGCWESLGRGLWGDVVFLAGVGGRVEC